MSPAGTVAVLGSLNMDVVLRVARFPAAGETIAALAMARHAGGKGLNQAIAAARAGAAVGLTGAVGADADGRALLALLRQEGVDTAAVRVLENAPTGIAHILVDDRGENQIVVASGANAMVRASGAAEARILLAQLETPLSTVVPFFAGRAPGAVAILNAAPFTVTALPDFAGADMLIVNETELAGYAGERTPPRTPQEAIALAERLRGGRRWTIIVTLGAAGSITIGPDGATVRPGVPAAAVDTTGAGDCFCGYLAAGLAAGRTLDDSVALAHRAAAVSVGRPGAAASIPRRAEL